jgi:hypothetical protein
LDSFTTQDVIDFIRKIADDNTYLIIPMFSTEKSLTSPFLTLSDPFLVNNKSNSILIVEFILKQ